MTADGGSTNLNRRSASVQAAPPRRLIVYATSLALIAAGTSGLLVGIGERIGSWWAVAVLTTVAAVAERGSVAVTSTATRSVSLLPTLFAAVLFGPLPAMIVAAGSMILVVRDQKPWPYLAWTTYTSSRATNAAIAGAGATYAHHLIGNHSAAIALAAIVSALLAETLDIACAALTLTVRRRGGASRLIRASLPMGVAAIPLYVPVVALLVIAYEEVSPYTLPLFMAPTLAAQRMYGLYQEQRQLTEDVLSINQRLERANLSFATALVATLDARDQYTAGHSAAVAIYARDIAARMGLSSDRLQLVQLCGLVHDIGKIGLPAGLLEKPGALTLEERRLMERHSEIGERILAKVEDYTEIAGIVRHHHERVDGHGYPDGLVGDAIPLLARIIAVADAYNAMTSDRPYRDAMPTRVARMRLAQAVENQFDTAVVAAFEAILASSTEDYRVARGTEFLFDKQERASGERVPLALAARAR